MANRKRFNGKQIVAAIKGSAGSKSEIARRLGVHRHTIDNYLDGFPAAKKAYDEEIASEGDYAEAVILFQLHEQELTGETDKDGTAKKRPTKAAIDMAWKYATKKLRERGYGDTFLNINPASLTLEQLERLRNGEDPVTVLTDAPKTSE